MNKEKRFILSIIAAIVLVVPASALPLGSQSPGKINFSDALITQAELDIADQFTADPGIMPDSPLYPLKRLGESLRFTLAGSEDKAKLRLEFAKTRLAETRHLLKKKKLGEALKSLDQYNDELNRTEDEINKTAHLGANISVIAKETEEATLKHVLVLELVKENVPDEAKDSIERVIEKALEKKSRIAVEKKRARVVKEHAEKSKPQLPEGRLIGATIPAPPPDDEIIETEITKEIQEEKEKHRERARIIKEISTGDAEFKVEIRTGIELGKGSGKGRSPAQKILP